MSKQFAFAIAVAVAVCATVTGGAAAGRGTTSLCVGGAGCFSTLQAAVDAAHDGDTLSIGRGTFAGGVMIDVSVDIRGAGAGATTIRGGGPVLTLGKEFAPSEPTISIRGVTIAGGVNTSAPDHAVTHGGGVLIPQGGDFPFTAGATVTIRDSVITGNTVYSEQLLPAGFCGPHDCSFANGGGIFNEGRLTLVDVQVTHNRAGNAPSSTVVARGGGILSSHRGTLTLVRTTVTENRAEVGAPVGGGASAGGIAADGDTTIADSDVSDNAVLVTSTRPGDFDLDNAIGGGIVVGGSASIKRTTVRDNSVSASYAGGIVLAVAGGISDEGVLDLSESTVERNRVRGSIPAGSHDSVFAGSGGIQVLGEAVVRRSRIVANHVTASAPSGVVGAGGGGLSNFGALRLEQTIVAGNDVTANGSSGFAHGGGIENVFLFGTPTLELVDSVVAANRVAANPAVVREGGGLYTAFGVTLTRTLVIGNRPGDCFGC